jgi:predicted protein tyrosine phosphatase
MIYVSPLSAVEHAIRTVRPSHLVSLLDPETMIETPEGIQRDRHLRLPLNDIAEPNGTLATPSTGHVAALIGFIRDWDQRQPILVHCWAGISRSTAAAFIALCALNEDHPEDKLARLVRAHGAHAHPNRLMVQIADDLLGREGRMQAAIEALGPGRATWEGELFALPAHPDFPGALPAGMGAGSMGAGSNGR